MQKKHSANLMKNKKYQYFYVTLISISICYIAANTTIFADSPSKTSQTIADDLGWISATTELNFCRGYYEEPTLRFSTQITDTPEEINIAADQTSIRLTGTSTLSGNVTIDDAYRHVSADRASILHDKETSKPKRINLYDNVHLREAGKLIISDAAQLNMENDTWELDDALYRINLDEKSYLENADTSQLFGINAWGMAKKARRLPSNKLVFDDVSYSTCSPLNKTWELSATQLTINNAKNRGEARNVVFRIKNIPVFYFPYFNFPLTKERKTGFLMPTVSHSEKSGFNFIIPFYWNMAPNYDMTLAPRYYEKRGILWDGIFRYLTKKGRGELSASFLSGDREFSNFKEKEAQEHAGETFQLRRLLNNDDDRYSFHVKANQTFNSHWSGNLEFNKVSDDYYFQDFGAGSLRSATNQLLREAKVNYVGEHWRAYALAQGYQTLHPINQSHIEEPYDRLPQLVADSTYYDISGGGLNLQWNSELVSFQRSRDPITRKTFVTGERLHLQPTLSYPIEKTAGFLTPSLRLAFTHYNLDNVTPNQSKTIDRFVPLFSLDSGLFFERPWKKKKRNYTQTLEPRIYYLFAPLVDQDNIPVFDSSLYTFSTSQLFRMNRFSGIDRIGDANQLSLALTSRLLDSDNGEEKIKASLGQIYYFRDRDISLCDSQTDCEKQETLAGNTSTIRTLSPLIGTLNYHFNPNWQTNADVAWDVSHEMINTSVSFHYQPSARRMIDLGYRFTRDGEKINGEIKDLEQTNVSFFWPINKQLGTIGHWTYNVSQGFSQLYFLGFEYEGCCWALRAIGERAFTDFEANDKPSFDTTFYLQVLFKGLGNIGTNNAKNLLSTNLPGYEERF